jgi:hypothetical protein
VKNLLQGICVDTGETTVLEKGKKYFLFPGGSNNYYVSKFPNANAHTGCFRKSLFQIVQEDEWPPEPPANSIPVLDNSKVYKAKLVRKNDRDYQVSDVLLLQEYNPKTNEYTGRELLVEVTYITDFGQPDNQVVMSIAKV